MPLSDWTQALSGQGVKLHKSLSKPHTWWHFEPVQTIIWSLRFTSSTPSIPTASCQPACLHSERAGEIKCQQSISKKQRSPVKKIRLLASVQTLNWGGVKPCGRQAPPSTGCKQYSIRAMRVQSGRTKSLLKTGLTSTLHQVAHSLVQPSFENLQKWGFRSLSKTLFQYLSTLMEWPPLMAASRTDTASSVPADSCSH